MADGVLSAMRLQAPLLLSAGRGDQEGRPGDYLVELEGGGQRIMTAAEYGRATGQAPAEEPAVAPKRAFSRRLLSRADAPGQEPAETPARRGLLGRLKRPAAEPPAVVPPDAPDETGVMEAFGIAGGPREGAGACEPGADDVSIPVNLSQIDSSSEPGGPSPEPAAVAPEPLEASVGYTWLPAPTPRPKLPPAPMLNPPRKKKASLFGKKRAEAPVKVLPDRLPMKKPAEAPVAKAAPGRRGFPLKKKKKVIDLGPSFKWREPVWI